MWFANERPSNSKRIKFKIMAQKTHVVVLGNGFDKYLGRPTSYKEFYDNVSEKLNHYPAPLIKYLEGAKDKIIRWYDLENSLFEYYNNVVATHKIEDYDLDEDEKNALTFIIRNFPHHFENVHYVGGFNIEEKNRQIDAIKRLIDKKIIFLDQRGYCQTGFPSDLPQELLPQEENSLLLSPAERDKRAFLLIKKFLKLYLSDIPNSAEDKLYASADIHISPDTKYQFFSFNYTPFPFDKKDEKDTNEFYYVHGSCFEDNIILGTRECDIKEKEYRFLQKTFDPNYQPASLAYALLDADEVTIFGHSLGTNDRQYFEGFFKRQCSAEIAKKGMPINIYTLNEDSIIDMKRSLQELTNYHLSDLMQFSKVEFITTA